MLRKLIAPVLAAAAIPALSAGAGAAPSAPQQEAHQSKTAHKAPSALLLMHGIVAGGRLSWNLRHPERRGLGRGYNKKARRTGLLQR